MLCACVCSVQVGGAQVVSCKYEDDPAGATGLLEVIAAERVPSLQQLLAALVPAGKPLTTLRLQNSLRQSSPLELAALQGCSAHLAGLESLLLSRFASGDAVLAALLQLAPRLRELVLRNYFENRLPPSLVAKQGLETLQLIGTSYFRLFELPPGPYLSSKNPAVGICADACTGVLHVVLSDSPAAGLM